MFESLGTDPFTVLFNNVEESWKSKNTRNLVVTPEPLPETSILANHSYDFSPAKRTQSSQTNRPGYGGRTTTQKFISHYMLVRLDKETLPENRYSHTHQTDQRC